MTAETNESLAIAQPGDEAAAARSEVYALLAEAFTYPEGSQILRLLDGDLVADLTGAIDRLPLSITIAEFVAPPLGVDPIRETQRIHNDLFGASGGAPLASMLERSYGDKPEQQLWEDLLRYYKFFGLDFSKGQAAEQADHLLTELGFMHYLCFLEAGVKGSQDSFQRGQRDFLSQHLAKWVDPFAGKLGSAENAGLYGSLGQFLNEFVASDLNLLAATLDD